MKGESLKKMNHSKARKGESEPKADQK